MFDQYLSCKSVPFLPEIPLWLAGSDSPWWSLEPGDLAQTPYADPYWAFCWPGGAALARFLLDQPHWAKDRWVYDIGTGCGVVALAAKKVGARAVVANDIDPWALRSTEKMPSSIN